MKFKLGPHQYLLAYEFSPKLNQITLLDVGVHENFYRDLQKYRDSR
ncbi:MAG: type II toxin-antitoxin system RelE/ParE family toxin [Deltaproteobacteria bacterium]|nr:type II toxin-antitoxin system RelE/ParE family toxin [Deltaproteobacteria bacterium]